MFLQRSQFSRTFKSTFRCIQIFRSHITMSSSHRQQPEWQEPRPLSRDNLLPPLKIWNSLTRSKTAFVPIDRHGKKVTWYACGPTVYDDSHLGHARTYLTSDIIRRIMRDYFQFDVRYVMNVTDVDDKVSLGMSLGLPADADLRAKDHTSGAPAIPARDIQSRAQA